MNIIHFTKFLVTQINQLKNSPGFPLFQMNGRYTFKFPCMDTMRF